MERRIIQALQSGRSASQEDRCVIQNFLRQHCLHEYYSPLPFASIFPHLTLQEYLSSDIVFEQGETVDAYCFLIMGRAIITRRHRQQGKVQRCLVDGPSVLGECLQGRQARRERTARVVSPEATVLSIPREILQTLMAQQLAELNYIMSELAVFSQVNVESMDRVRLAPLVRLEKYRLKETVRVKEREAYLIVDGECRVSCKRREVVVSKFNCLSIARYFHETEPQECTFSTYTNQMTIIVLNYESFPLLPSTFLQNIRFLHQARREALQQAPFPRLERQTNPSLHQQSPRYTHKARKSSSLAQLDDGMATEVQSFRKKYVLGFYTEQAAECVQSNGRKLPKEPQGYFELKVRAQGNRVDQQLRRRQWASYLQARSQQKTKSSQQGKGNLKPRKKQNTPHVSPKHNILTDLFNRYQNLPSLPQKKSSQLAKAGRLRQFHFSQQEK